jgi:hypothetical protein
MLNTCRTMLRSTASILTFSIVVGLAFGGGVTAQDEVSDKSEDAPKKKVEPPKRPPLSVNVGPKGVGRYRPGQWGIASVESLNRTNEPMEFRGVVWFGANRDMQFSRKIWLPARSRRRTWIPVLGPLSDVKPNTLMMNYAAFTASDSGEEKYIDGATIQRSEGQPLMVPLNPTCFLLVSDQSSNDASVVKAIKFYVGKAFNNRVSLLSLVDNDFPMFPEALDVIDCIILSGDRIAESAAGIAATRAWIRRGGRLWVMADRVSPETLEALVGDQLQITELDRITLTDYTLEPNPSSGAKAKSDVKLERPVELVRVLANGGTVTHNVGDWPAAIRVPVGQGYVLVSMLALNGWMPTSESIDRAVRKPDAGYDVTTAAMEMAALVLRSKTQPPIADDTWKQYLAQRIGYSVPDRSLVMFSLVGYCLAMLVAATLFRRAGQIERLIWFVPAATIVVAATLVVTGTSSNTMESNVHVGQLIEVERGLDELVVSGVIGAFNDETVTHTTGTTDGGLFLPDASSGTGTWRMDWQDIGEWKLKDLKYPAGSIRFAPFTTTVQSTSNVSVRGTFNADGFIAEVKQGSLGSLEDRIVVTRSRITLPLAPSSDGKSVEGRNGTELPPGEFLVGSLLSDEQQRRQNVLREVLAKKDRSMDYPNGPTMMAWAQPLDMGFVLPDKPTGSALVTIPIDITRPEPGSSISIPAPFVTFRSVRGTKGAGFSSAFKNSIGLWTSSSSKGTSTLRFQVPKEILPATPERATLKLTITAPSRTVTISSGVLNNLQEITTTSSPVGEVQIPITDATALALDDHGGLHIAIQVSEVEINEDQKGEFGTQDQYWRIDFVQLEVKATID